MIIIDIHNTIIDIHKQHIYRVVALMARSFSDIGCLIVYIHFLRLNLSVTCLDKIYKLMFIIGYLLSYL